MEQNDNTKDQTPKSIEQEQSVKNEPDGNESDPESEAFLDEILQSAEHIAAAVVELSKNKVKYEPNAITNDENEQIDPDFFDEILTRKENEVSQVPTSSIRNQTSLKRERLHSEDVTELSGGQQHTAKRSKESEKPKRRKSREPPVNARKSIANSTGAGNTSEAPPTESSRPRIQIRAEFGTFRTPTSASAEEEQRNTQENPLQTPIETYIGTTSIYQPIPYELSVLTPEEKMKKALKCATDAKKAFQKAKQQTKTQFYPNDPVFTYTSTVRKLPTSFTHFTQQIYDNRSPLHAVNNVTFQFNSMATRLNLKEWGLESLPPKSKAIAKILGCDSDTIFARKQSIKIPEKIKKSNQNKNDTANRELCDPSSSSLFINVMTQTDDVKVIPNRRRGFYRDVALQNTPSTHVIGTQTNSAYTQGNDLPLFNVIRNLNENQLEALDDFVQFIMEPAGSSSMDVYQQRKRLADIYKTAQIPVESPMSLKRIAADAGLFERRQSAPPPPPPPPINLENDFMNMDPNTYYHPSERQLPQHNPHIRGVHSQPLRRYNNEVDDKPTSSVKFYGRGGMRR